MKLYVGFVIMTIIIPTINNSNNIILIIVDVVHLLLLLATRDDDDADADADAIVVVVVSVVVNEDDRTYFIFVFFVVGKRRLLIDYSLLFLAVCIFFLFRFWTTSCLGLLCYYRRMNRKSFIWFSVGTSSKNS